MGEETIENETNEETVETIEPVKTEEVENVAEEIIPTVEIDIHNIKEVLGLAFAITKPILKAAKANGFQWTDLLAFMASDEFKAEVGPALEGMSDIGNEFKDFTVKEGFELSRFSLQEIEELLDAVNVK